ncbi:MAG: hypothetical protein IJ545_07295 [Alphaproteobacteria bacterium]|nr:hypothetical protein [Alphaproteobacteria bacterium]
MSLRVRGFVKNGARYCARIGLIFMMNTSNWSIDCNFLTGFNTNAIITIKRCVMIFRKPDHSETQEDAQITEIIKSAKYFAQKIAPDNWKENVEKIYNELTVVLCDGNRTFKALQDGKLKDIKFSAAAVKFWENIDTNEYTTSQGIAILPKASPHVITHESLHAFSSDAGKTDDGGGYIKVGSKYAEFDREGSIVKRTNDDLNETITDALTSRALGRIGPNAGASYASQVIMADLLMGEKLEDNAFIQDVYFGKSEKFAEDFDKTIKASKVKFADYLQGFKILGSEEDNKKSDKLLKGAVEYNLRKAKTAEEIDHIYAFQQKIINFYKDGGITTNFMEDEDISRMENLLKFADKMQKQCKSNLVAQQMIEKQFVNED